MMGNDLFTLLGIALIIFEIVIGIVVSVITISAMARGDYPIRRKRKQKPERDCRQSIL